MNSFSPDRNGGFGNKGSQAPNLFGLFSGLVGGLLGGGGPQNGMSMGISFPGTPREEEPPQQRKRPGKTWGRPEDDIDPGFHRPVGPGTAIPMPQYDGLGDSDALFKPIPMSDGNAGGGQNWLATGEPSRPHDWLQRDEPVHPFYKDHSQPPAMENSSGPAKASQFRDPRTGKFDYWGWLDAGMANLGKGGVLFEDDAPDVNAREGILDKPAAMTAAESALRTAGCRRNRASRREARTREAILAARLHTRRRMAGAVARLKAGELVREQAPGRGRRMDRQHSRRCQRNSRSERTPSVGRISAESTNAPSGRASQAR